MPAPVEYPPFPEDVPTHPLLIVDYALIKQGDVSEINKLWEAGTSLGFWYLKNHGVEKDVDAMFDMGAEMMNLPMEEKMKFEQGDSGSSFGYKAAGLSALDETGKGDTAEFLNIAKDDALAWPSKVHRDYPEPVNARMEATVKPFVQKSAEINNTLISVFNDKLGLPKGTLTERHKLYEPSCSEARCIKNPPRPAGSEDARQALPAHTDFGSLSFLHNRLGGLQVMPPGHDQWSYIKPLPGHAICNLGDAIAVFSGGVLRSNLHRVVAPPREQGNYERWSLVFFSRPANHIELNALTEESPMIAEAVRNAPDLSKYHTGQTAQAWFMRRIKNMRIKNRTGPETWYASRGTEHNEIASQPRPVPAY